MSPVSISAVLEAAVLPGKPAPRKAMDIFESVACSRCDGNPNAFRCFSGVAGGRCLRCMGALREFTKHGRRDYERWRAAVDLATLRPFASLKVGDAIRTESMRKYVPVAEIGEPRRASQSLRDGVWVDYFLVPVRLNHAVTFQTGTPLGSYKSDQVQIDPSGQVRVYPGADNMPQPEDYVTPVRVKRC